MTVILGKSLNDYIKVITLPVAVWFVWRLISLGATVMLLGGLNAAMAGGGTPAGAGAALGVLGIAMVLGLVGLAIEVFMGAWIGWRTVTVLKGSYPHAVVSALLAAVITTVIAVVLGFISNVLMGSDIATVMVGLLITAVIGFVVAVIELGILAVIGVFVAGMMKKK